MSNENTRQRRALLVITSHDTLGDTGKPTGYTVMEAADPWKVFTDAGWAVDFTTVAGGRPPEDGFDRVPMPNVPLYRESSDVQAKLDSAPKPGDVDPTQYDIVYYVGGHAAMFDFPGNADVAHLGAAVYENGGVVAAVCHGPAALTTLRLSDGSLLIAGRNLTGFSNAEEKVTGAQDALPFLIQTELAHQGAGYTSAGILEPYVVTDGRLVTGQNPVSAGAVAEAALLAVTGVGGN
jgi:putative intracellular protease/amidase